jgi:mRNA interferase MazF
MWPRFRYDMQRNKIWSNPLPNPGDIVIVEFPGAKAIKRRPALVLSSEVYHEVRPDVIVGLITGNTTMANGPTDHLLLDWRVSGLRQPSAFRSFLVTLPQSSVEATVGRISERDWLSICVCVRKALAVQSGSGF